MSTYAETIKEMEASCGQSSNWSDISPEYAARMRLQNRFKTGLDIARYTAAIMRKDMADYDSDPGHYTQSLGCWHGFIGQQKLISIKKHFGNTDKRYLYLSGWMIAALRSDFGPLPDQSMHEKTSVPGLIEELYTFLRQADARELGGLFRALDKARESGNEVELQSITKQIDEFQTHVVPIIADIDAGFGNEEATYLLAKRMIDEGHLAAAESALTQPVAVPPPPSNFGLGDEYDELLLSEANSRPQGGKVDAQLAGLLPDRLHVQQSWVSEHAAGVQELIVGPLSASRDGQTATRRIRARSRGILLEGGRFPTQLCSATQSYIGRIGGDRLCLCRPTVAGFQSPVVARLGNGPVKSTAGHQQLVLGRLC